MAEGLRSKKRKLNEQVSSADSIWSNLPSVPLVKIYSFLSRSDQCHMSRVCKQWSEGFKHPSLWKFVAFTFSEENSSLKPFNLIEFVNFQALKHARFDWCSEHLYENAFYENAILNWVESFKKILNTLKKSQLISVKFRNFERLSILSDFFDFTIYKSICKAIANFLGSQPQLQHVDFFLCSFKYQDGLTLLKKLVEDSRDSITHLSLKKFVDEFYLSKNEPDQTLSTLAGLPKLVCLEIDYSLFLGRCANPSDVQEFLKKYKSRLILYTTSLFCWDQIGGCKRWESIDWKCIKNENPDLQIDLFIHIYVAFELRCYIIVQDMPIKNLYLFHRSNFPPSSFQFFQFFTHLLACNSNKHLVSLVLAFYSPIPDFTTFIPFINACEKLEEISLETVYPADGLSVFLEALSRSRPNSFMKFKLSVSGIGTDEKKKELTQLTSNFVQVFDIEMDLEAEYIFERQNFRI